MNEKPILFSGEMVRAILAGRKAQTRRIIPRDKIEINWVEETAHGVKPYWRLCEFSKRGGQGRYETGSGALDKKYAAALNPYGQPGDRLWVKETHLPKASGTIYRADFGGVEAAGIGAMYSGWKPSIFCKRSYSRITLEIVSVRVERLKDISNEDCFAEGLPADSTKGNRTWYGDLWEEINGKGSWDANPWVWVVAFKKVFNIPS